MKQNILGRIIFWFGIAVIVIGIIQAYIMASNTFYDDGFGHQEVRIEWRFFFQMAFQYLVDGMIIIGISEVIKLLHNANGKISGLKLFKADNRPEHQSDIANEVPEQSSDWKLEEMDVEKIYELYSDAAIIELLPSQMEGYCVVKLQKDEGAFIKIVDVGGFSAQEVQNPEIKKKVTDWYNDRI
ncbi:hypothetical protein CIL05_09785 [Virgibacillus profundi]|uniref:Uncharacterized protein n=1 Tax=Virgibacillus profundi TaxID=2024555 RepID=A0A2A2IEH5_9BACI|nr:hypothetical protein [Virgibacillus profundi]PAV29654.1 hypothetical protein CIL05_09785 [Virgibacillus profundi]PXY53826.1 hypothetical protein CIT14_09880 [Virgibacillus profundi]